MNFATSIIAVFLLLLTSIFAAPNAERCLEITGKVAAQKERWQEASARGADKFGGFAFGIDANEIQEIADSFSIETLAIRPMPHKNIETILLNASYRRGFWDKVGVLIRDIAGSHLFNDANHRITFQVVKKLMDRNGVHPVSDQELYNVISKVGRRAPGYLEPEDIAKALRGY